MKIAINTRFLLPNKLEGIGWYTYEVAKRLVQRHPEHEFIFLFDRPHSEEFIFADNVRPVSVFPQARHPFLFWWWFEKSLPAVFRRLQPDVFFSPDGFCSLRGKVPTLLTIHDIAWQHFPQYVPYWHRWHYQRYMPRFAKRAEHILTVSEYSKQDIVQHLHVEESKITVAYPAGSPLFQPLDTAAQAEIRAHYTQGQAYFLYVGSIHPRKNVPRLLLAFDEFKQKTGAPMKLVLAGRMAWQTGEVGTILNKMKHREEVIFLGYISTEIMAKVVASAYTVVYPSLFEGFGIPIVEAMQSGVAVITSETSSMPEAAGDAALLVNPYSVESIAGQMELVWREPGWHDILAAQGLEQCRQFSWERTIEGVEHAFAKMGFPLG